MNRNEYKLFRDKKRIIEKNSLRYKSKNICDSMIMTGENDIL